MVNSFLITRRNIVLEVWVSTAWTPLLSKKKKRSATSFLDKVKPDSHIAKMRRMKPDSLRVWWTAISRTDPGTPFEQLFASIILVNNNFNEA